MASLLDIEFHVSGVTSSVPRPELQVIGKAARMGGGHLKAAAGELDMTAHWGSAGKEGICMPSNGRLTARPYSAEERTAIHRGDCCDDREMSLTPCMFQIKPLPLSAANGTCCNRLTVQSGHNVLNVALADGSVHGLKPSVSSAIWYRLLLPRDGALPGAVNW